MYVSDSIFHIFRLSNLVHTIPSAFDRTRHLCRADFIVHKEGISIVLKWTKNFAVHSQATVIRVPNLGASPLCPIQVFRIMLAHIPASRNHWFGQVQGCSCCIIL